jgi:hypothetical protein
MSNNNVNININGKNNASPALNSVGKSVDTLSGQMGRLKAAFGLFVGARVLRGAVSGLMDTASMMDEVGKSSDKIGIATESLISLRWAAKQSGIEFDSLEKSLIKMSRNLSEVASGGGKAVSDSLGEIGLSARQLMTLKPEDQIGRIADGLNALPNQADKIRIAMDIFGKAGADMLPLLNEGSAGMREFVKEAGEMGMIFSREDAAQMEAFNDQISKMTSSLEKLKVTILGMAAPNVTAAAQIATDTINGTSSVESRAFWSIARRLNPLNLGASAAMELRGDDIRSDPSLANDLAVGPVSQEDIQAGVDAARAATEEHERRRMAMQASAIGRFTDFLSTGSVGTEEKAEPTMKDAAKAREEVLEVVGGIQAGFGMLIGAASESGLEVGTSLVKGIEVGWDQSQQRLKDRIQAITDAVKTPREEFLEGMKEVDELAGKGLDQETANRQRAALKERFEATLPSLKVELPQLANREFRALTMAPGANSPELRAAQEAQRQTKIAERQALLQVEANRLLKDIADQQPQEAQL